MRLSFDEYQKLALRTMNKEMVRPFASPAEFRDRMACGGLGLAGEAGEAADQVKKYLYHGHSLDLPKLKNELGDILWYVATLADALDMSLGDVAQGNVDKLKRRYPEGFSPNASINRVDG